MKVGEAVHDYTLGKNGIIVGAGWAEKWDPRDIKWEWLVLYADGELMGADTGDLKVICEER